MLGRTTKASVAVDSILKGNAKDSAAPLKPSASTATTTTRPRTALAQQDKAALNASTVAGKRKRDALGDATNGKAKNTITLNSKVTGLGGGSTKDSAPSRASSVSTNISATTKENATAASTATARTRAPLGVKSRNVATTTSTLSEKEKVPSKEVATRRPLVSKSNATTTTTSRPPVAAKDVTVSRTRKVTHTTVHQETKTQQIVRKAHGGRVATITKVEDVKVEEVDEDDLRSHKRPRLSDEVEFKREIVEAKEFANITVEEVKEVLSTRLAKPEDEQPDDLDKDDVDDPLMVAEYVVEIFDYLRLLEV